MIDRSYMGGIGRKRTDPPEKPNSKAGFLLY
jgi:hypothetical protein